MKTVPKFLVGALAVMMLGAGASLAQYPDYVVKRIEHPNGQPTFAYVPVDKADGYQEGHTVALYREGRGVGPAGTVLEEDVVVDVPLHRGRGEVIYVRSRR